MLDEVVLEAEHEEQRISTMPTRRHALEDRARDRPAPHPLERDHQHVPAVQGQERQQVEDRERQRDERQDD